MAHDGKEVNRLVAHNALAVDEEGSAQGDAISFGVQLPLFVVGPISVEYVKVVADGFVEVGNNRVGNALNASVSLAELKPSLVGRVGVGRAGDKLHVALLKLSKVGLKLVHFNRANSAKVFGVKE